MKRLSRSTAIRRLGMLVVVSLGLPLCAGLLVDNLRHSSPMWSLLGAVVGTVIGAAVVCRAVSRVMDDIIADGPLEMRQIDHEAAQPSEEEPE